MDEVKIKYYLTELENVIRDRYNPSEYHFLGTQDSSICIMKNADKWDVFFSERARKRELRTYDTLMEACLDFLDRLGTNDDAAVMKNEFLSAFEPVKTA